MSENPCPHSAAAEALFTERAKLGLGKYGTTLADAHLTPLQLLQHLSEEIADALVYVEGVKASLARVPSADSPMRERVTEAITGVAGGTCYRDKGVCGMECMCGEQIDAVMAVIEGPKPQPAADAAG